MNWLLLVSGALATWRLTHMLVYENGPYSVFRHARERAGVEYGALNASAVLSYKYEITICPWCLSVWVGACITLIVWFAPALAIWLLTPMAFSAVTCLLETLWDRGRLK